MTVLKLKEGATYRVKYARYRNPFAGVAGVAATLPVTLEQPGVFQGWRKELSRGDLLIYQGRATGAGSDPGLEERFADASGAVGAFEPTRGAFGGISAVMLEVVTPATERLRECEYRLVTATEYDAAEDKPEGLDARAAVIRGDWPFVIYDPEYDSNGFMLWGDDPEQMAQEACDHLGLLETA